MLGALLFIGATALTIVLERLGVPTNVLVAVAVVAYTAAALIGWWPRWVAAWSAWRGSAPQSDLSKAQLLVEMANERVRLIQDIRMRSRAVNTLGDLALWNRDTGRWFGKNEYLAQRYLHAEYPREVGAFLVHGQTTVIPGDPNGLEHLKAHLWWHIDQKLKAYDALIEAVGRGPRSIKP